MTGKSNPTSSLTKKLHPDVTGGGDTRLYESQSIARRQSTKHVPPIPRVQVDPKAPLTVSCKYLLVSYQAKSQATLLNSMRQAMHIAMSATAFIMHDDPYRAHQVSPTHDECVAHWFPKDWGTIKRQSVIKSFIASLSDMVNGDAEFKASHVLQLAPTQDPDIDILYKNHISPHLKWFRLFGIMFMHDAEEKHGKGCWKLGTHSYYTPAKEPSPANDTPPVMGEAMALTKSFQPCNFVEAVYRFVNGPVSEFYRRLKGLSEDQKIGWYALLRKDPSCTFWKLAIPRFITKDPILVQKLLHMVGGNRTKPPPTCPVAGPSDVRMGREKGKELTVPSDEVIPKEMHRENKNKACGGPDGYVDDAVENGSRDVEGDTEDEEEDEEEEGGEGKKKTGHPHPSVGV